MGKLVFLVTWSNFWRAVCNEMLKDETLLVHGKVTLHFLTEKVWSSRDERDELLPHGKVTDADYRDML